MNSTAFSVQLQQRIESLEKAIEESEDVDKDPIQLKILVACHALLGELVELVRKFLAQKMSGEAEVIGPSHPDTAKDMYVQYKSMFDHQLLSEEELNWLFHCYQKCDDFSNDFVEVIKKSVDGVQAETVTGTMKSWLQSYVRNLQKRHTWVLVVIKKTGHRFLIDVTASQYGIGPAFITMVHSETPYQVTGHYKHGLKWYQYTWEEDRERN